MAFLLTGLCFALHCAELPYVVAIVLIVLIVIVIIVKLFMFVVVHMTRILTRDLNDCVLCFRCYINCLFV